MSDSNTIDRLINGDIDCPWLIEFDKLCGIYQNAKQDLERKKELLFLTKANIKKVKRNRRKKNVDVTTSIADSTACCAATTTSTSTADFADVSAITSCDALESTAEVDISTNRRPKRAAKVLASSKIRKQTIMPLNGKLRRPDKSDEVDKFGYVKPPVLNRSTRGKSVRETNGFAKPKPRKRGLRQENVSSASQESKEVTSCTSVRGVGEEEEVISSASVRDKVAYLEGLIKQKDTGANAKNHSTEKTPKRQTRIEKSVVHDEILENVHDANSDNVSSEMNKTLVNPKASETPRRSLRLSNARDSGNEVIETLLEAASKEPEIIPLPESSPRTEEICASGLNSTNGGIILVGHEISISPVAKVRGSTDLFVENSPCDENDQNIVNTLDLGSSSRWTLSTGKRRNETAKTASNPSINVDIPQERSTRTRNRRGKGEEKFEEGLLESTRMPGKSTGGASTTFTFERTSPLECIETAKDKRTKPQKRVLPSEQLMEFSPPVLGDFDAGTFVIPDIPAPVPSKRTKRIATPVVHDSEGKIIVEGARSTRTKTLACSSNPAPDLPTVDGMERRSVRTKTKVRRFGEEETELLAQDEKPRGTRSKAQKRDREGYEIPAEAQEKRPKGTKSRGRKRGHEENLPAADDPPLRCTRSKGIKEHQKQDENSTEHCASSQKKVVKGKRRSQKKNMGRILNPYKTPLSSQGNNILARKVIALASASKGAYVTVKTRQEEFDSAQKLTRKEALAAQKKEQEILQKRILLKQKNEEKLKRVQKCREEKELEKQEQIIQAEREKELKRKQLLEEQRARKEEELSRKKQLTAKKMHEIEERRRQEQEARMAKIRELELEMQRPHQAKLEQQQLDEKRARERERMERKKLQEDEKLLKLMHNRKLMIACNKIKCTPNSYKARNENDFGLEDEHSEVNSDEESPPSPKKAKPLWVASIRKMEATIKWLNLEQMTLFIPPSAKTPDIRKMCSITPTRILRRNSSAVWDTPGFSP